MMRLLIRKEKPVIGSLISKEWLRIFYGIANDEAMTNKKMRKKGCSSLQKKPSSLVSVTHSGVHLLILGMEVMLYLDSLQREL